MTTKTLISKFYAELNRLGIKDLKDEIIWVFTDGRTTHVSELSFQELSELLKTKFPDKPLAPSRPGGEKIDYSDKLRKRILSICHQLHWNKINYNTGRHDIDWQRLSNFLQNHFGNPNLNHYSYEELQNKIIPAFNSMLNNYLNKS